MKCPKCGNEYEGVSCQQCNGPKIIINDNDYLRRKKEWEESGKILGVYFIRQNEQEEEEEFKLPELPKVDIQKVKKAINSKVKKSKVRIESIDGRKNKKSKENQKNISSKDDSKLIKSIDNNNKNTLESYIHFFQKNWLRLAISVAVLIILIFSGTGIYRLYKRMNMTLYIVGTDGRICTGGTLENKVIGNTNDVIFNLNGDQFFEKKLPSELSGKTAIYSYASDNGQCFVTETYDEAKSTYALYVWNDNTTNKVSENSNQKEVKYISDNGKTMFTDITYLYEGTISNISLYVYNSINTSDLTLIDKNVRSEYLYLKNNTLMYLNSTNKLYSMNFSKLNDKTLVGEDVKDIYGISAKTDNLYSNSTEIVKPSDISESILYTKNGEFYYYDIDSKDATFLFRSALSGVEIVYEKSQDYVYCISMSNISFGEVKKDSGATLTVLDDMSSTTDINNYNSTLLYVNKSGDLISVNKGEKQTIRSGVSSGSLNLVRNDDGITYIADGAQYYRSSLKATEIKLQDLASGNDTSQTLLFKKYLYFMDSNGQLCSCNLKGKELNTFGAVKSYWVK